MLYGHCILGHRSAARQGPQCNAKQLPLLCGPMSECVPLNRMHCSNDFPFGCHLPFCSVF